MTKIRADDELRERLEDLFHDRFQPQPRPNDYADDSAYDEAAAEHLDRYIEAQLQLINSRDAARDAERERTLSTIEVPNLESMQISCFEGESEWRSGLIYIRDKMPILLTNPKEVTTHVDRGAGFTHIDEDDCACLDPNAKEDML